MSPNEWGLQIILPVFVLIHQQRNFKITEGKEFPQRHLIESATNCVHNLLNPFYDFIFLPGQSGKNINVYFTRANFEMDS